MGKKSNKSQFCCCCFLKRRLIALREVHRDLWGYPNLYVWWRVGWALIHASFLAADLVYNAHTNYERPFVWFAYVTNWAYLLLVLNTFGSALTVVFITCSSSAFKFEDGRTPWYLKGLWFSYAVVTDTSLLVTALYFTLEYKGSLTVTSGAKHAGNSVYVLLDMLVTATPIYLLHVVYIAVFVVVYLLFSLIYWAFGGINDEGCSYLYSALNFDKPRSVLTNSTMVLFVGVPFMHLSVWLLFKLRVALWTVFCRDKDNESVSSGMR